MLPIEEQFPVVAIGASAGGLEAFTDLLRHLPADTGMAFVFIQHLAPDHASMLAQLLARETTMTVSQVEEGTVLSPNHVYVIPPNAAMTVSGLALVLRPRQTAGTAIDAFLRSLAVSRQGAAIAVILSGTGSDGALGVQAISEEGGIVFAQEPASAKFDGMPRSAIATGDVDLVLPTEKIGPELARIAREPHFTHIETPKGATPPAGSLESFQTLLDLLHISIGIDFSLYRQTTVQRRVLRRLALTKQTSLSDYVEHLKANPDELHALAQDILIRVTRFFRDPEAFDVVCRRVFPALIRRTPLDRSVRIWVPGCSTGEEAYTLAMCFLDVAEQMRSRVSVQVFATDINEAAVEKARRGEYIENIAADVPPKYLARYFVRTGREFQVSRRVRDACVFSRHDLLHDPPFSRMDLVSCRNVLIYLDSVQEQAFSRLHFALNPGGFLLLGKSEAATSASGGFAVFDKETKLYVRQESVGQARATAMSRKDVIAHPVPDAVLPVTRQPQWVTLRRQADRVVAEKYGPLRVIIDGKLEAIAMGGPAAVSLPSDSQSHQILRAARQEHAAALKDAVQKAAETGQTIRIGPVKLWEGASVREVAIEVTPLAPDRQHYLLVFERRPRRAEPIPETGERAASADAEDVELGTSRLEEELATTRAHLEAVIIEQEASNEEVVASNEELQSLNEELESSKEELEATNQELTTVNQELQVRNTELDNAREFAQATNDTVRSSLLVLGPDLRVLKANQSFYRTFRMSPMEVEHHFIYELGQGQWSTPRLRQLLEEILPANQTVKEFGMEYESPIAGRRILLLNAHRFEREERILLAIDDVTESRRAEEERQQAQKMEAIGYLAAGVAHDFNNLLTSIMGNAYLLLEAMPEGDHGRSKLNNVIAGAEQAADLTRQLLAYAGKGRAHLERLDLSELVVQTSKLIHRSIPDGVQLRLDLDRHLPLLLADPSQMQQVVMNLIINAAEAIDVEGVVRVRTGLEAITDVLPDSYTNAQVEPGEYVFLEVVDNGSGMDEQTRRKIFDPFFTTKFTGRGLGLAAVLGIVRQHKGSMQVHSVPGRGSSFKVMFALGAETPAKLADNANGDDLRGTGTVLVVDDEEMIRSFANSALEAFGYSVLLARDAGEGIRLLKENPAQVGLVLLDVAMPGMGAIDALDQIRRLRPDIPVIVSTGFGDLDVETRFAGKDVAAFFPKPYTVRQLARKVKELMPASGAAGAAS